ncbi:TonB-dependent receptor [Asticcacaulis sp. YBE204]|uniref:TonB-dependent receptor n=1 Tax=Asticcacaulis sp. YBE204 TaxID=1282363 RepID=UPI0004215304|nr:TonB-dependent receptor [Asticcacaulis sp. YBE204]
MTDVVVTGIRASARSSLAIKKNSQEIVDSITAEDIGKLPDPNVSETLTRIPGVQGYRYGGEGASPVGAGSGITIRGLSGQTASQINSRVFFTAGSREFNIESAIPGMVAGIDVYKNPSAEHIEGGIGGLVNVRTRNPSDFKGKTFSFGVTAKYNDLAQKTEPEIFGLAANRFDLANGGRIGVMLAGVYQKSVGRSDNNPANGGPNFKRMIRADSAEYSTLAAANTSNSFAQARSEYVGRSDVWLLANVTANNNVPVTTGLTSAQISNIIVAPALTSNVFQETIIRERKGLNFAADYRVNDSLRFYTEFNYLYYLYNQNYRGLNSVDGGNVQNVQTAAFNYDEALANRNINGGTNDVLASQRLVSGQFLRSTVNTIGGDEHRPYETWTAAAGVEWSPSEKLDLKADFAYIKSDQTQDNRSVNLDSAAGLTWTVGRVADGEPHQLTFSGPSLSDPTNFVLRDYANGTNQVWDDKGYAVALSGVYHVGDGYLKRVKFGTRYAYQESLYKSFSFTGRNLTTDGLARTANFSNALSAAAYADMLERAPSNFMGGEAGYAGGYVVFSPNALLGNQVRQRFPNAGILAEGSYAESLTARRYIDENTLAAYVVAEFADPSDRLRGNIGVRYVKTEGNAIAKVTDTTTTPATIRDVTRGTSYDNVLPSLNLSYDLTGDNDFLLRFGYGRGMTRAGLADLNPSITVNQTGGTATQGNPDLKPQIADSIDVSLERYFSGTNYLSLALFNKNIDGFFTGITTCQTVATAPAYTGTIANSCTGGQYLVTRNVNSQKGYVRGLELAGQYFFDKMDSAWRNVGVSGSYTYVDTSNPVNFGTAAAPVIVDTQQPMQSQHNYTLAAMYDDSKLSARLVYTWRSESILFNAIANPIDGRMIQAYGILDASVNYELSDLVTISFNASNLTDQGLNRFVGEPGDFETGIERQHFKNGRNYAISLRYKFGG